MYISLAPKIDLYEAGDKNGVKTKDRKGEGKALSLTVRAIKIKCPIEDFEEDENEDESDEKKDGNPPSKEKKEKKLT
jgi:hypothetical protein